MEKLYVGLDIGSSSVGWAVTDEFYNIKRLKGKKAWGSRIFSEAKTKAETRMIRSNRRRLARRKYRIQLLQELFAEELVKVDPSFFARLANSNYSVEDKPQNLGKNLVFKTKAAENEFYNNYPTIWHLRRALLNNDKHAFSNLKHLYLAIHHIIKYRGNFLLEGTFSSDKISDELLSRVNDFLKNKLVSLTDEELDGDFISSDSTLILKNILLDSNFKKTVKQKKIRELFNYSTIETVENYIKMFSVLITGGSYKLSNINSDYEGSITFESNFDDVKDKLMSMLQEDFELVAIAKEIYDFIILNDLLGEETNISNVMCNVYEEHKKDLELLKKIIINIDINKADNTRIYDAVFKADNLNNYAALIGSSSGKRISPEDFNVFITKILKENEQYVSNELKEGYLNLLNKSTEKRLLKMISHYSTSVIPHQLHLMELEKILANAADIYPFIAKISSKIILLFKFRNHYAYGPLDSRSKYSNVVRYNNEVITPWNIHEVINDGATKEKFMRRLTNSCSYLLGEKVMPKVSLAFEKFLILDKLNVMKVNGESLKFEEKEEVMNYLLSRSKTTIKQLKQYLANKFNMKQNDIMLSNISEEVIFEATSHAHLSKYFDIKRSVKELEYLIYLATVYADDKKTLKEILLNEHKMELEKVKCVLTLPTKKWAPISSTLLNDVYYTDNETGECFSILELMIHSNNNLQMTLYHKKYNFVSIIEHFNNEIRGDESVDDLIDELLENTPSFFRRSIHQTLLILDDIKKASNQEPSKIFIEVTREDDENKKGKTTNSREQEIYSFIESLKKDSYYVNLSEDLISDFETIDKNKIKNKHIYLYFKQMGIDVYTGKHIDINDVIKGTKYDLDHIIPQSLIKDDSIDNLVLVEKSINERIKGDKYPIPQEIKTNEILELWYMLRKLGAISEKKFNNLMRCSEISLEEIEGFVYRKINAVNYSNVVLKNILEMKYPNTKVVFSKAQYPSFVREYLEIAKNRNVNDTHHAVDAYLNIFCGNVLSTTFSDVSRIYLEKKEDSSKTFNMISVLKNKLNKYDNNNVLYCEKIKNTCLRRDILVTYKVDYNNGAFHNATIESASDSTALIPIHSKTPMRDTSKYGGYSGLSQAYLMAIEYTENGKKKKCLTRVPVLYTKKYFGEELVEKVLDNPKANDIKLIRTIHLNQKIRWQQGVYLVYTSNSTKNKYKMAYQNYLNNEFLYYIDKANKYLPTIDDSLDKQSFIVNKFDKEFVISKEKNILIFDELISTSNKKVYDTCNYIVKLRGLDRSVFATLTLTEQLNTLNAIIMCLSKNAEMSKFPEKMNGPITCILRPTMNILDEDISIIYESPTGLYSHEVKI